MITDGERCGFFLLVTFSLALGFVLGANFSEENMMKLAIKHQCGQYNPQTGNFEWKDK